MSESNTDADLGATSMEMSVEDTQEREDDDSETESYDAGSISPEAVKARDERIAALEGRLEAATGGNADDGATAPEATADDRVAELESEVEELRAEKADLENQIKSVREVAKNAIGRLEQLEAHVDGEVADAGTTELDKWVNAPESMLDQLSNNKRRAVILAKHWDSISWRRDKDTQYNVETKSTANAKNHPSLLKYRLEQLLDESLATETIYRIMRHMALMSGGEKHVDEYGREHIEGGEYEYHQKVTPDGESTYRLVVEVGDG